MEFYDNLTNLQFVYGHYETPFPVKINANHSIWMEEYCCEWVIDNISSILSNNNNNTIIDSVKNSDLGLYSACTFPSANWHRLEKLMKWCTLFFLIDDYHDQQQQSSQPTSNDHDNNNKNRPNGNNVEMWHQMLDMLNHLSLKSISPNRNEWPDFIRAVEMLLKEIYFDYSEQQIKRSVSMFSHYVIGNILESEWSTSGQWSDNNKQQVIPDWNDYIKARCGSVGGQMTLQLVEYAKNIELNDEQWTNPFMKTLIHEVSVQMILVNDYLTFRKEVAEYDYKFSKMCHSFAVLVNQGLCLQDAVDEVHRMIKKQDETIFDLINKIMADSTINKTNADSLKIFLDGVQEVVGGYWRYAVQSRRYHGFAHANMAIAPYGQFIYDQHQTIIIYDVHSQALTSNNNTTKHQQQNYKYKWLQPIPHNVQPR